MASQLPLPDSLPVRKVSGAPGGLSSRPKLKMAPTTLNLSFSASIQSIVSANSISSNMPISNAISAVKLGDSSTNPPLTPKAKNTSTDITDLSSQLHQALKSDEVGSRLATKTRLTGLSRRAGGKLPKSTMQREGKPLAKPGQSSSSPSDQSGKVTAQELVTYEHALHAIYAYDKDPDHRAKVIQRLQRAFRLSSLPQAQIQARVECSSGPEFLRQVAQLQLKQLDAHPMYPESAFGTKGNYREWKENLKKRLLDRIAAYDAEIVPKATGGVLRIEVLEGKINRSVKQAGKDLVHKIANATVFTDQVYEPYVRVTFLKHNKETHYVEGSKTPTWNETFMMDFPVGTDETSKVKIHAYHRIPNFPDALIGKVKMTLADVKAKGGYLVDWFELKRGKSSPDREVDSVKLSIMYLPLSNGNLPGYTPPNDTNELYKILLDKLVAFDSVHSKSLRAFAEKRKQHTPYLSKSNPAGRSPRSSISPDDNDDGDEEDDNVTPASVAGAAATREASPGPDKKAEGRRRASSASEGAQNRQSRVDLSQESSEVLRWFSKVLNVPPARVDLTTLEMLAYLGENKEHLDEVLSILKIYDTVGNRAVFTTSEEARYTELRGVVVAFVDNGLYHMIQVFPRPPAGTGEGEDTVFASAVKLFAYFHQGKGLLDEFRKAIRTSAQTAYGRAKFLAEQKAAEVKAAAKAAAAKEETKGQGFEEISETMEALGKLVTLCDESIDQVDDFINYYTNVLPKDVNTLYVVVEEYVKLFAEDVKQVFSKSGTKVKEISIVFQLYNRILYLFDAWKLYSTSLENRIPIYDYMDKHIIRWLDEIYANLSVWAANAMQTDDSTPLSSDVLHSSSVVDLFNAAGTTMKVLETVLQNWNRDSAYKYLNQFSDGVGRVAVSYCRAVQSDFDFAIRQFIAQNGGGNVDPKLFFANMLHTKANKLESNFNINLSLCVKMNDVDVCRQLLNDFATQIGEIYVKVKIPKPAELKLPEGAEEYIRSVYGNSLSEIKSRMDSLLDNITEAMNPTIQQHLSQLLKLELDDKGKMHNKWTKKDKLDIDQAGLDAKLEPLFGYLNEQLEFLTLHLYQTLFKRLLKQLFLCIATDVQDLVLPIAPSSTHTFLTGDQLDLVRDLILAIKDFVQADGEGLPAKSLEKEVQRNLKLVEIYPQTTEEIVSLLNQTRDSLIKDFVMRLLKIRAILLDDKMARVISEEPEPQPVRLYHQFTLSHSNAVLAQIKQEFAVQVGGQMAGIKFTALMTKWKPN